MRDKHHLVQMTSPVESIASVFLVWSYGELLGAHIVPIINMLVGAGFQVGEGYRTHESIRDRM